MLYIKYKKNVSVLNMSFDVKICCHGDRFTEAYLRNLGIKIFQSVHFKYKMDISAYLSGNTYIFSSKILLIT